MTAAIGLALGLDGSWTKTKHLLPLDSVVLWIEWALKSWLVLVDHSMLNELEKAPNKGPFSFVK